MIRVLIIKNGMRHSDQIASNCDSLTKPPKLIGNKRISPRQCGSHTRIRIAIMRLASHAML